jgi:beta-glucanase (GH16 family)
MKIWLLRHVTMRIIGLLIVFTLIIETACSTNVSDTKTNPAPAEMTLPKNSSWKLAWSDEFNGSQGAIPDPHKWVSDVGGEGWGNKQLEYDTDNQNAYQDGQGNLVIEARKGNPAGYKCWYGPCDYTSARITTREHFSFTYGLIEARIKIPYSQGIWSAFWLLGNNCGRNNWPACGEIDVMENTSPEPATIHGSAHGPENFTSTYSMERGSFADDFHIFAVQWDANHIYFFVDGDNYATLHKAAFKSPKSWVYDHPFDVILNVAVGGDWPGAPDATTHFPQKMYVSYVRLYQ